MALLHGRAGRLTAKMALSDPGSGNPDGEWVISMPFGERSVSDIIASEQQAGRSTAFAAGVLRDVCRAARHLHAERSLVRRGA